MGVVIPFDLLFLQDPYPALWFRLAFCAVCALSILLVARLRGSALAIPLILPALLGTLMYFYFLVTSHKADQWIFFIGNLMVTFFSYATVYRYPREQWTYSFVSVMVVVGLVFSAHEAATFFGLLTVCHFICIPLAIYFRREFHFGLSERFSNLCHYIPQREAKLISTVSDEEVLSRAFTPRTRFNVCLCADWRSYQRLSANLSPEVLSGIFELYYEILFRELERVDPQGNYYANWVADELFVIFYDENDQASFVMDRALRFAKGLTGEAFERVQREVGQSIRYDVGMAAGYGFLGLQGPRGMKKTTITSENAGVAKRLEAEAKRVREKGSLSWQPILVVNEALRGFAIESGMIEPTELKEITVDCEDLVVRNEKYFAFQSEPKLGTQLDLTAAKTKLRALKLDKN
ncbi:MAG: hypothetical protein EA369_09160 [Bradymonadales bacterium]|nr:MAG: hypothetical protein EA369_09160 [Bradymonadales bacterium]